MKQANKKDKKDLKAMLQNEVRPYLLAMKEQIKETNEILKAYGGNAGMLNNDVKISIDGDKIVIRGPQGEKGEQGAKGDIGPRGFKGDPGKTGPMGKTGPKGDKGDIGPQGEKGKDGVNGITKTVTEVRYQTLDAIDIRNKLESLTGGSRLKMSAIKGLGEVLDDLRSQIAGKPSKASPVFAGGNAGGVGDPVAGGLVSFESPLNSISIGGTLTSPEIDINLAHSNTFTASQAIDYTSVAEDQTTAFTTLFSRVHDIANDEYGFASLYGGITDYSNISGEIEDKIVQKSGFEIGIFRSNDSTVNWIDGHESLRGYTSYLSYTGTFQGSKHDVDMIGHDITVLHQVNFSNDGTHLHRLFGNKINVMSTSSVSIDSFVTREAYGEYVEVSVASGGDVTTAYGVYIKTVEGGANNYAIYSEPTAKSKFNGAIEVPDDAYDASSWNNNLEVPTKNAIRDKIESMGTGGGWVTAPATASSAGTAGDKAYDSNYFYICVATNTWKRVQIDTWVTANVFNTQNGGNLQTQDGNNLLLQPN